MVVVRGGGQVRKQERGRAPYPTHDGPATAALGDHVAGALAGLGVLGSAGVLHVPEVGRAGAKLHRRLGVDGDVLVGAVQRRDEEHLAVLQHVGADLATGARQAVERVEVDPGGDGHDDAGLRPVSTPGSCQGEP